MRRILLLLLLLLTGATAGASAQARATVSVALDDSAKHQPRIRLDRLFEDQQWRDAVQGGVDLRVAFKVERWQRRGRSLIFGLVKSDALVDTAAFTFVIRRNATLQQYESRLVRVGFNIPVQVAPSLGALGTQIFGAPIPLIFPPLTKSGEYYYNVIVEITTLNPKEVDDVFFARQGEASLFGQLNQLVSRQFLPGGKLPVATSPSFRIP